MQEIDQDDEIRAIIVTGGEKVFAAGADIKEMAERGPFDERIQDGSPIATRSIGSPSRSSPPSAASLWAAAASWP